MALSRASSGVVSARCAVRELRLTRSVERRQLSSTTNQSVRPVVMKLRAGCYS